MNCYYITFLPPEIILCICKDKILAWGGETQKNQNNNNKKADTDFWWAIERS